MGYCRFIIAPSSYPLSNSEPCDERKKPLPAAAPPPSAPGSLLGPSVSPLVSAAAANGAATDRYPACFKAWRANSHLCYHRKPPFCVEICNHCTKRCMLMQLLKKRASCHFGPMNWGQGQKRQWRLRIRGRSAAGHSEKRDAAWGGARRAFSRLNLQCPTSSDFFWALFRPSEGKNGDVRVEWKKNKRAISRRGRRKTPPCIVRGTKQWWRRG